MKHNLYSNFLRSLWQLAIPATLLLTACDRSEAIIEPTVVGMDRVDSLEISPNGPVLIANGENQLQFALECFYTADAEKKFKRSLLSDRIDASLVTITASDGQTFKADQPYSTKATTDSVHFTASYNGVTSGKVSVALRQPSTETLKRLRIPIVFTAVYSNYSSTYIANFNEELLQATVDRANKVFAGTLSKTPNRIDSRIEFYIKEVRTRLVTAAEDEDLLNFMKTTYMSDVDQALHVWILDKSELSGLRAKNVKPRYTLGNPSDIPGLSLRKVTSAPALTSVSPENAVLIISFADLYRNSSGLAGYRFETMLGRYYGLLLAGEVFDYFPYNGEDVDYCPDTYSYNARGSAPDKYTLAKTGQRSYIYASYNLMEENSACNSISEDQVKRIRQVIKDCPFRQHAEEVSN